MTDHCLFLHDGATSGAGSAYTSGSQKSDPISILSFLCRILWTIVSLWVFFLRDIVLSVSSLNHWFWLSLMNLHNFLAKHLLIQNILFYSFPREFLYSAMMVKQTIFLCICYWPFAMIVCFIQTLLRKDIDLKMNINDL